MFHFSLRSAARATFASASHYRGMKEMTMTRPSEHVASKEREGYLDNDINEERHNRIRRALNAFSAEPEELRRLTKLPGVERESDLPADPITRLFFQRRGDLALHEGTYDVPLNTDDDRVILKSRTNEGKNRHSQPTAMYDFCHRIREAGEQGKRFVIVPSTDETKGVAKIMFDHGVVAGFRDFHNDRAFAVELKYFQNEHVMMGIEPGSYDYHEECLWSPKMVRRMNKPFGIVNRVRIYCLRTWDGRILDQIQAGQEQIGGKGLCVFW